MQSPHRGGPGADRGRYRPDIDGLRAVAVGVVVAYHAFPRSLPGGFIGVDVFFVISGYLISGIILGALAEGRFSFANFYARRIRRIFPSLAAVLAAAAVAGWFFMFADDYQRLGRHLAAGAGFASNFVLWQESSYFDPAAELKPLLHLWSLGIEEQFYLIWPLLLVLASSGRLGRRRLSEVGRGPLGLTVVIGAVSLLLSIYTVRIDRTAAFFAPWTRFWELLAGALLACVEIDRPLNDRLARVMSSRWLANGLAMVGMAMIAGSVVLIDETRVFPGLWALLPVGGTFLLLVSGQRGWINRRVLSLQPLVWLGLISYPLYLWHWPLLSFARLRGTPSTALLLSIVALSVVLAWLTYRIIEWPIRFGPHSRRMVPMLSSAMVIVFAVGLVTNASGGFIGRPINRSDAAHLVDFYERMRKQDLRVAYRAECDFMDWVTEDARLQLDPSCTAAGGAGTVLLWGDSFAQALSLGIREQLPQGAALAQVATSGCPAAVENFDLTVRQRRCETANLYALDAIRRLKPKLVVVAQSAGHDAVDWPRLTSRALELGALHVLVVGPFPVWRPSLPRVVADYHLHDSASYLSRGLDRDQFDVDRGAAAMVADLPNVTYVSLLNALCRDGACLARVPGGSDRDLMALDFGHLTPMGSSYVGRSIFKQYLD